jgi:hypothetical protein
MEKTVSAFLMVGILLKRFWKHLAAWLEGGKYGLDGNENNQVLTYSRAYILLLTKDPK